MVAVVHDDDLPNDRGPRRELDVSELGRRLSSRRWWLIGPTLACLIASTVAVNVIPPRYTAETKILLENGDNYFTRPDKADVQPAALPDDEAVQSQVQLVSSRDIARQAIKQLDLQGNPEFDPLADGLNPIVRVLVMLGLESDPMRVPPEERLLTSYFDKLTVFPVTKSRVLTVEFTSKNPDLAAKAANTIADIYMGVQSAAKRDAARAAADSLRTLIASLRVRSAEAEAKAQALRNDAGLLMGTNNATITSQQLSDMSLQLAQARTQEADAQAKAKLIREMVKAGRIGDVPDVANNELIRRMSEQRANLQADYALQSRTLLPGHPRMQELSAQLADVDRQLRAAADKAARTLDNDALIAASRVENLTAAINTQKAAIGATGPDQVKLSELDLNAKLLKDQLEFNTAKYQEAVARENAGSTPADARIISRAVAPQLPSFPKKLPMIAIITLAGAILSLGILIARELLSGRAFVAEEPASALPVTVRSQRIEDEPDLVAEPEAVIPLTGSEELESAPAPVAERRTIRNAGVTAILDELLLRKHDDQALRVLLADVDAVDRSGRSTLALGRALSRSFRVIAVDLATAPHPSTDLKATLVENGELTEARDLPGLSNLLSGQASFAEVIHRDAVSRLHFIPQGRPPQAIDPDSDEDGIANVLDALAETYDFVLIGGVAADSEIGALIAADHCDTAVLCAGLDTSEAELDRARLVLAHESFDVLVLQEVALVGGAFRTPGFQAA